MLEIEYKIDLEVCLNSRVLEYLNRELFEPGFAVKINRDEYLSPFAVVFKARHGVFAISVKENVLLQDISEMVVYRDASAFGSIFAVYLREPSAEVRAAAKKSGILLLRFKILKMYLESLKS